MLKKPIFWFVILLLVGIALDIMLLFPIGAPLRVEVPKISLAAEEVFEVGPLKITNTLIATWLSMIVLIVVSYLATRRMQLVPRGLQNVVEFILDTLRGFVGSNAGAHLGMIFPAIATLFLFIIVSNWMGLLPGYLSIVVVKAAEHGEVERISLLRSAATDLNLTLALAISSVAMSQYFGAKVVGFPRYLLRFVNITRFSDYVHGRVKRGFGSFIKTGCMGAIDLFVSFLELFDEFTKILSFSFRLFGNIFAGEVLMGVMVFLVPYLASLPFLGLEIFVGAIQALVFAVLSTAFFAQAMAHHGSGSEAHAEHEAALPSGATTAVEGN